MHICRDQGDVKCVDTRLNEGLFEIESSGGESIEALIFEGKGWFPRWYNLVHTDIAGSETNLGEITITHAGTLDLSVIRSDGLPVLAVDVWLVDEEGESWESGERPPEAIRSFLEKLSEQPLMHFMDGPVPLSHGRLLCTVPAGTWSVRARAENGIAAESEHLAFHQDRVTRVKIELGEATTISGVCVGLDGVPIPGIRMAAWPCRVYYEDDGSIDWIKPREALRLLDEGRSPVAMCLEAETDGNGEFTLSTTPPEFWFHVYLAQETRMIIIEPPDLEGQIVQAGTRDFRFVLKKPPPGFISP